ncbi:dynamin family protein [Paenibacillus tengchongensis]|uniref:dynamin family protein n=1 Tax=Paenibacillus tengchongensis TaxID=2608684 RepID=UPI00124C8D14|nr:dynamin family protein [Paenibacillus tengchongensis]
MVAEQVKKELIEEGMSLKALELLLEDWGANAERRMVADLQGKLVSQELTLAFCGHFSAGKSSMINRLCGTGVLPSGPVPTSANVVAIRSGQPRVLLYPRGEDAATAPREAGADSLQEYCRSGEAYEKIEIWTDAPLLGQSGVLLDTPGVDSTDDGHRAATHSALHLADVVFYVMDYNHVQSENNLAFAKALSDWGKPLYLIVNQVDKHREREIPLADYRRQLETAFTQWGIRAAGLLFTSLKVPGHPLNQWHELTALIGKLLEQRAMLLQLSAAASARHAGEEALKAYRESRDEERQELLGVLEGIDAGTVRVQLAELATEEQALAALPEEAQLKLRSVLDKLLADSNLMPADVREAAAAYLLSAAPGFRAGIFSGAAKREKERGKRLDAWHQLLSREINARLGRHLLQALREWAEGLELWTDEAESALVQAYPAIRPEWLAAYVQPGTGFTGEALLNFCRGLAAEIKADYRRAALALGDQLLAQLPPLLAERRAALARRGAALQRQAQASAALAALDRAADARADALAALLPPRTALTPGLLPGVPEAAPAPGAAPQPAQPLERAAGYSAAPGWAAEPAAPAGGRRRLAAAAAVLHAAAEKLRAEPALGSAARGLAARAQALAAGRFTLALFGAFSAGKSSFANALLGEEVLPVSPHPATAAVNRILAPDGITGHGQAVVTMKTAEEIWEDILHSFQVLQLPVPQRATWTESAAGLTAAGLHPAALPHAGFLRAAASGWKAAEDLLGSVRTVDLAEYRGLVAEETRACFVRGIDLYYDCPLTAAGIVLVDTPGADSLHARHTGVTFNYMKNADAILFLTYYNHAFSKADRSLLAQLGRIKDSFALDKMFFIINASDLAGDEAELDEVRRHVADNLRAAGLASPRIFALSSLLALEGKLAGDRKRYEASRFQAFEQALAGFAGEELPRLALHSAGEALASVRQRAEEWRQIATAEAGRREENLREWQQRKQRAESRLSALAQEERPVRNLRREGEELIYHVRQRLTFGFGRFFQESFHPSLLREDNGKLREIFTACGRELERTLQRELEQELWATTLRLEQTGRRLVQTAALAAAADLSIPEQEALLLIGDGADWAAPAALECRLRPFDWSQLFGRFKSPRHFFEGPGRNEVRAAAEPWLKEAVAGAAAVAEETLLAFYAAAAAAALGQAAQSLLGSLQEQETALTELLKGGDAAGRWEWMVQQLADQEGAFNDILNRKM